MSSATCPMSTRVAGFPMENVWTEFSPLAAKHEAIPLGQGFPDENECPAFVRQACCTAAMNSFNQYSRSRGHVSLVKKLAELYTLRLNRPIDWESEVMVGAGATEVLWCAMQGLINSGDEVVCFQPSFDIYRAQVEMSGGVFRPVTLRPDNVTGLWGFQRHEFEAAMSSKTKVVLLNTPHNPTGFVLSLADIEIIADILKGFPHAVVITDEVYEHLIYSKDKRHTSPAELPSLVDRTLIVSSSGKTFSCTGWKVGWTVGPAALITAVWRAHQWTMFSVCSIVQEAIARVLTIAEEPYMGAPSYYQWLVECYRRRRDILVKGLEAAGFKPYIPEAGYFIMANTESTTVPLEYLSVEGHTRDWALARWLTISVGVSPIPPSAFYMDEDKKMGEMYTRFAFCKSEDDIEEACRR